MGADTNKVNLWLFNFGYFDYIDYIGYFGYFGYFVLKPLNTLTHVIARLSLYAYRQYQIPYRYFNGSIAYHMDNVRVVKNTVQIMEILSTKIIQFCHDGLFENLTRGIGETIIQSHRREQIGIHGDYQISRWYCLILHFRIHL